MCFRYTDLSNFYPLLYKKLRAGTLKGFALVPILLSIGVLDKTLFCNVNILFVHLCLLSSIGVLALCGMLDWHYHLKLDTQTLRLHASLCGMPDGQYYLKFDTSNSI